MEDCLPTGEALLAHGDKGMAWTGLVAQVLTVCELATG